MTVTEIWQTNSPARIASGPFVVGNKVIFTTWAGKLIALRFDTGAQLWKMDARQGGIKHEAQLGDILHPVIREGVIYVQWLGDHTLFAVDLETGKPRWSYSKKPFDHVANSSVVIDSGVVYHASRHLFALDEQSGRPLWKFSPEIMFSAAPVIDEKVVISGNREAVVYGIDKRNGKELWRFGEKTATNIEQEFQRELIKHLPDYEGIPTGALLDFAIGMCELTVVAGKNKAKIMSGGFEEFFGPEVARALRTAGSAVICPPGTTKTQLENLKKLGSGARKEYLSPPLVATNSTVCFVIVSDTTHSARLIGLDTVTGAIRFTRKLRKTPKSLAANNGLVFVLDAHNLLAIRVANGEQRWSLDLEDEVNADDVVIVTHSVVHVISKRSNRIISINADTGRIAHRAEISFSRRCEGVESTMCIRGFEEIFGIRRDSGEVQWRTKMHSNLINSRGISISHDRIFYATDNAVFGAELRTGVER